MSGECNNCAAGALECNCDPHPWGRFLNARYWAILWMREEMEYDDQKIAEQLSMDAMQVYLIRNSRNMQLPRPHRGK